MFKNYISVAKYYVECPYKRILNRVLCKPEELISVPYIEGKLDVVSLNTQGDILFTLLPDRITSLSYLIENPHAIQIAIGTLHCSGLDHTEEYKNDKEKVYEELKQLYNQYAGKTWKFSILQLTESCEALFKNPIILDQGKDETTTYIVVLGNSKEIVMAKRIEKAIEVFNECEHNSTSTFFVFTGGVPRERKGVNGIAYMPECLYMKEYAVFRGVPSDRILLENVSKNTSDNIHLSHKLIVARKDPKFKMIVVTSAYHIKRAELIGTVIMHPSINVKYVGTSEIVSQEGIEREHQLLKDFFAKARRVNY